jgi:NIPSNAP protein
MANTALYLHETIDILGTGSEPYKAHTGKLGAHRTDGGAPLVGTWQQSGSTGTWPTVINLWEMRGWDHWAEILDRQYTRASGQEPKLKHWWTEATKYRSGGFDRILEPAPFSPTRQELIDRKVRGRAVIQEIATVKPGRARQYLDAVAARWRPIALAHELELVGAFTTTMRETEAVLLWSVPDFATYTRHLATFARDRAVRRWSEYAHTWRIDYRETLLVPSVWCVTHPDWKPGPPPTRRRRSAVR